MSSPGKSVIVISCDTNQATDLKSVSLVLVGGPIPSQPGFQYFQKVCYHNAFDAQSLGRGELRYDIPTSLFQNAQAMKAYLAESAPVHAKPAEEERSTKESQTMRVSESTSGGRTTGSYVMKMNDGTSVTTHRMVYSSPSRRGTIEVLDTRGVKTQCGIWVTVSGGLPEDLAREIDRSTEQTEKIRISNILSIQSR
jgi:hypothetical protein